MNGDDLGNAMADAVVRLLVVAVILMLAIGFGIGYACGAPVEYPIQTVSATEEAGVLFNRKDKKAEPEGDCPGGVCPRTSPVEPIAPAEPTPQFEPAPSTDPIPPGASVETPAESTTGAALTPEQKQKLGEILVQVATFLIGAFMGSGSASPFIKMILEKLLATVGGGAAPGATPARVRRRATAKKK